MWLASSPCFCGYISVKNVHQDEHLLCVLAFIVIELFDEHGGIGTLVAAGL